MREAATWELDRIDPPSRRGEVIPLVPNVGRYVLGRSLVCSIPLYTATASRQHAEVFRRDDGEWVVAPLPERLVLVDGEPLRGECELCEGLSLVMGADQLRCRRSTRVEDFDIDSELPDSPGGVALARRFLGWLLAALAALAAAWAFL